MFTKPATLLLIVLLLSGQGYAQDELNAKATYQRGWGYYNGIGTPKDLTKAAKWYRKAAELGESRAQFNLGRMYAEGNGVPQDKKEAEKWFLKADKQGHLHAKRALDKLHTPDEERSNRQPQWSSSAKPPSYKTKRDNNRHRNTSSTKTSRSQQSSATISQCNGLSTVNFSNGSSLKANFRDCKIMDGYCEYTSREISLEGPCKATARTLTIQSKDGDFQLDIGYFKETR